MRPPTSCFAPAAMSRASSSGSGLAEAMERMARAGQAAGRAGPAGRRAAAHDGIGGEFSSSSGSLAERQRALAEELQRMQGQGNMPGAGELADEAKELARRLEAGRLDRQMVERQERLFRRMLDAGRTLQGTRGGRAEGAAEHHGDRRQRAAAASAPRASSRVRTDGCGSRPGKSCSSSRRRSDGWW